MKRENEKIGAFSVPFGKNKFAVLAVRVDHMGNGINYFSGNSYSAGHRLYFSPCTITGTIRSSVMMSGDQWESGFYVKLDDSPRKNPHYIKRAMEALDVRVSMCVKAFEMQDIEELKRIAADIHAAAFKSPSKAKPAKIAVVPKKQLVNDKLLQEFKSVGRQEWT